MQVYDTPTRESNEILGYAGDIDFIGRIIKDARIVFEGPENDAFEIPEIESNTISPKSITQRWKERRERSPTNQMDTGNT